MLLDPDCKPCPFREVDLVEISLQANCTVVNQRALSVRWREVRFRCKAETPPSQIKGGKTGGSP